MYYSAWTRGWRGQGDPNSLSKLQGVPKKWWFLEKWPLYLQNYLSSTSSKTWNKFCFQYKSWKGSRTSKECILCIVRRDVNSTHFSRGGWQLEPSFSQSFLPQSQWPYCSKYTEFSKTPPTFAFWMYLKVDGHFPRIYIFLGHLVDKHIMSYVQETKNTPGHLQCVMHLLH